MWKKAARVFQISKRVMIIGNLGNGVLSLSWASEYWTNKGTCDSIMLRSCGRFEALLSGVCFAHVSTCLRIAFLYNAHINGDHTAPSFLRSLSFVWWRHSGQGRLVSAVGDCATRESSLTRCICIFVFVLPVAPTLLVIAVWLTLVDESPYWCFFFSRERFKCIPHFSRVLQAGLWVFEEAVCTITNWDPTQMQTRLLEVCIIMELCRIMLKLFLRRCFRRHIREGQPWMLDFITIASWISSHLFSWHHPPLDGSLHGVSICHTSTSRKN